MVQARADCPPSGLSHAAETTASAVAVSDQITIEDTKINDTEINYYVLVKFRNKKQHLCYIDKLIRRTKSKKNVLSSF
jgi:hypothetical protein